MSWSPLHCPEGWATPKSQNLFTDCHDDCLNPVFTPDHESLPFWRSRTCFTRLLPATWGGHAPFTEPWFLWSRFLFPCNIHHKMQRGLCNGNQELCAAPSALAEEMWIPYLMEKSDYFYFNSLKVIYFYCESVRVLACMLLYVPHRCSAYRGQKRAPDPLDLELLVVVGCWKLNPDLRRQQSSCCYVLSPEGFSYFSCFHIEACH